MSSSTSNGLPQPQPHPQPAYPISAAARLRQQLSNPTTILACPGVYDGFTARVALCAGFDALYMTGAGTTMSLLGQPDLGIATQTEMASHASMLASLDRHVPVIADADTGYGGPIVIRRTVHKYMQAGVAGLHLEDQVLSKRCGHLAGKELVDADVFLSRIRAAVLAREELRKPAVATAIGGGGADIVIIARTDALQGFGFEEGLSRLKAAVEVGADVAFLEGIESEEQARRVCEEMAPTPVLLNMVAGGVTPDWTVEEARKLGFRIIIFPGLALGPVYEAVSEACKVLKETGAVKKGKLVGGPRQLFEICGLSECMAFDKAAGGSAYAKGV